MRPFAVIAVLLIFASPFAAQAECEMAVADLPEVHGLRLGRSRREVERVYTVTPTSVTRKDRSRTSVEHLEGLLLGFDRDSLAVIEFDYDRDTAWKNIREFASFLENSLKLPIDSWVFVDRTEAVMKCRGFRVAISSVRNTLTLTDTFAASSIAPEIAGGDHTRTRIAGQ